MSWHPVFDLPAPPTAAPGLSYPDGPSRFHVEEIPLYAACGEGEHLYIEIQKRDIDTPELVRRAARALGVPAGAIGWAGLKDRHARARQRLSVPRRESEAHLAALPDAQIRVLRAAAHRNKLRVGHLAGNRFILLLEGRADREAVDAVLSALSRDGLPNYYGFQRFGRDLDNHLAGRDLLDRGRRPRGRRDDYLLSAYQSALFNRVLAARAGSIAALWEGDLAWIHANGAVFPVTDPEAEAPRAERLEISPTGPLPGRRMLAPRGQAGACEEAALAAEGWDPAFAAALTGGRRPLRVPVGELRRRWTAAGLVLRFTLPPGSFASVLVAQLGIEPAWLAQARRRHRGGRPEEEGGA